MRPPPTIWIAWPAKPEHRAEPTRHRSHRAIQPARAARRRTHCPHPPCTMRSAAPSHDAPPPPQNIYASFQHTDVVLRFYAGTYEPMPLPPYLARWNWWKGFLPGTFHQFGAVGIHVKQHVRAPPAAARARRPAAAVCKWPRKVARAITPRWIHGRALLSPVNTRQWKRRRAPADGLAEAHEAACDARPPAPFSVQAPPSPRGDLPPQSRFRRAGNGNLQALAGPSPAAALSNGAARVGSIRERAAPRGSRPRRRGRPLHGRLAPPEGPSDRLARAPASSS